MPINSYLSKNMTYYEVHKLSGSGFSICNISKYLNLKWRTVKRLWSIEDDLTYEKYLQTCSDKNITLEPYEFCKIQAGTIL